MPDDAETENEEDGKVKTLFDLSRAAAKTHPGRTFVREAPKGSGKWYFVDRDICVEHGHTGGGPLLQQDGVQSIEPEKCRLFVVAMRKLGIE